MKFLTIKYVVFVSLLAVAPHLHANNANDSTLRAVQAMKDDTIKVKQLLAFGDKLEETDSGLCARLYNQAVDLSEKLHDTVFIMMANNYRGVLHHRYNQNADALINYRYSYNLAKKSGNIFAAGKAINNIGNIYYDEKDTEAAFKAYIEAATCFERCNNPRLQSLIYSNISTVFADQELFVKAIEYGEKAIASGLKSGDAHAIGMAYSNMAVPYYGVRDTANNLKSSLKALQYLRNDIYKLPLHLAYQNLASIYLVQGLYNLADKYADSSLQIARQLNIEPRIGLALSLKGAIAIEEHKLTLAAALLKQAAPYIAKDSTWRNRRDWHWQNCRLNEAAGNYKEALFHYKKMHSYVDSLSSEKTQKSNLALEARYQTEKKQLLIDDLSHKAELQNLKLGRKNLLLLALAGALISIVFIALLYYQNSSRKQQLAMQQAAIQKQQIAELEKQKQLIAVKGLLDGEEQERTRVARDLHDGLGGMLSSVKFSFDNIRDDISLNAEQAKSFTTSVEKIDESIKELRRIAQNMMPENLQRFGLDASLKDLCNSVSMQGQLRAVYESYSMKDYAANAATDLALYRIAQEVLHNIAKHARATQAIVQLTKTENKLLFIAEDNGIGFDADKMNSPKGSGLKNMQNRIDYLKGKIHFDSSEKGTTVTIEIPI